MEKNVFIAPKIKVGYQKRDDTFTGKLAYVIYYDSKGKLRKETSWEGWRDKKLGSDEYDNKPMSGFTLNRDVQRSREWFGSGRNMIRIHDPRGFEFEVTCENLIEILMHTDCLRRGLIGEFVYAWFGSELVLLPTNSEEYQNASKYTAGLDKKVSAKNLVPGISYKTKREGDVIYIGKFNWYEYPRKSGSRYSNHTGLRKEEKVHVFTKDEGKTFFKKSSVDFLSEANSDTPVSNYAELVEKFNKKLYANKIVKLEFRPVEFNSATKQDKYDYYGPKLRRNRYLVEQPGNLGVFIDCHVETNNTADYSSGKSVYKTVGYTVSTYDYYDTIGVRQANGELIPIPSSRSSYGDRGNDSATLEQVNSQKFYDLYVTYENGKQRRLHSIDELTSEKYDDIDLD